MTPPLHRSLSTVDAVLFQPPDRALAATGLLGRLTSGLVLAGLYFAGVAHWLVFFFTSPRSFALYKMNFSAYQWPREYVFLSVLQEAVRKGVIPYHIAAPMKDTTRFLGIPDYITSPQIALLGTLDIATFVVVNTLLLYTLSFIACLLIRRRYRLSLVAFSAMTLLLNFNGNITAQIGAGQYVWAGFFLLPFLCLLILKLLEGDRSFGMAAKLALLLFGMMLQGTYHFYVWSVLFLLLLAAFERSLRRTILLAVATSAALVAYRVLPAALTFWGADRGFISGYPTVEDLLAGLLVIRRHTTEPIGVLHNLAWWEYDLYIGAIGGALLAYFGIWLRIKPRAETNALTFARLDWPLLLMALFALGLFFAPFASLPLPLFSAERVSSRFLIIPTLMLTVISTIRLNHVLPAWAARPMVKVLAIAGVLQLGVSLAVHSMAWRVSVLEEAAGEPFDLKRVGTFFNVVRLADPVYFAVVNISAAITAAALLGVVAAWIVSALRQQRLGHPVSPPDVRK